MRTTYHNNASILILLAEFFATAAFLDVSYGFTFTSSTPSNNNNNNQVVPTVNYFAYGSNMLPSTMENLRGIRPLNATAAILPNHRLMFDVTGGNSRLEPSAASVRPCVDDKVHGVLYEVTESDFWFRVSATEGVPFAYKWKRCQVYPYKGGVEGGAENAGTDAFRNSALEPVLAYTLYNAAFDETKTTKLLSSRELEQYDVPPSPSYLQILRDGARHWNMDRDYQTYLSKIKTADNLLIQGGLSGRLLKAAEFFNRKSQ